MHGRANCRGFKAVYPKLTTGESDAKRLTVCMAATPHVNHDVSPWPAFSADLNTACTAVWEVSSACLEFARMASGTVRLTLCELTAVLVGFKCF